MRGRIEKALSGFYYVNVGGQVLQCRARGKFRREGTSPLVGDWVQVRELGGGEGFVEELEPRTNCFARPAAANIDMLVIIASAAIPVTDPHCCHCRPERLRCAGLPEQNGSGSGGGAV